MRYQAYQEKIPEYLNIRKYNNKIHNISFKYFKNILKIQIFN